MVNSYCIIPSGLLSKIVMYIYEFNKKQNDKA